MFLIPQTGKNIPTSITNPPLCTATISPSGKLSERQELGQIDNVMLENISNVCVMGTQMMAAFSFIDSYYYRTLRGTDELELSHT